MVVSKNYKNQQKKCTQCEVELTNTNSNEYDHRHSKYICLACLKKKNGERYSLNKNEIRQKQQAYEWKNKLKIIENYGGKCSCCSECEPQFLTIDHITNNGAAERKSSNQGTGGKLYRWLIKRNFPKENYQLLCYNCNCAKGFFGICPHAK